VKKKDRERKALNKAHLNEAEKDEERLRNRERVKKHRQKRQPTASPIAVGSLIGYKSPQVLGKAKRKVEPFLQKLPRKRSAVIAALAEDAGLPDSKQMTTQKRSPSSLSEGVVKKVTNFYLSTSWVCPGIKDCDFERTWKGKNQSSKALSPYNLKGSSCIVHR